MAASVPFIALRWRKPAFLFAPLGLGLSAGLPGIGVFLRAPDAGPLAIGIVGALGLILVLAVALCRSRDRTMPVLFATTLSVTHALLFLGVIAALTTPFLGAATTGLARRMGADALTHSPVAAVLAAYLAAFVVLTGLASVALVTFRYAALTRAPAPAPTPAQDAAAL